MTSALIESDFVPVFSRSCAFAYIVPALLSVLYFFLSVHLE